MKSSPGVTMGWSRALVGVFAYTALLMLAYGSMPATASGEHYVVVHGGFQDAAHWQKLADELRKTGNQVTIVNLPGRPSNPMPPEQVTLDAYKSAVLKVINDIGGRVILVGHSFGGFTISNVAESVPERIKTLVYVGAYLPRDGESLQAISAEDKDNKLRLTSYELAKDKRTASVVRENRALVFCEDCSPGDKTALLDTMVDEPTRPGATPVKLTADRYGKVDKVYIKTLKDNAIRPPLQDLMVSRTPVRKVMTIDTGHSPFLSRPQELARLLTSLH